MRAPAGVLGSPGNLLHRSVVQPGMGGADDATGSAASAGGPAADPGYSFEAFVAASSARLFTMAVLLCGHDRAEAEDLLQGVLERAFRRWPRIARQGDPDAYIRQMLVNASVDRWRRLRRRREEASLTGLADSAVADRSGQIDDRDLLLRVLTRLPARQRAVIVLRYLEDLSEAQTAAVLGCSEGTVKSQASRALARLRRATDAGIPEPPARTPARMAQVIMRKEAGRP
jgi:RNA polymerase sigma-70 factor (sigma-E family)